MPTLRFYAITARSLVIRNVTVGLKGEARKAKARIRKGQED